MSHLKRIDQIRNLHVTPCTPIPEKQAYKPHAQADDIVIDAWARGLAIEQCEEELQAQGYMVSRVAILEAWCAMDEQLAQDV